MNYMLLQDWFHESCLNLRERPSSREPSQEPPEAKQVEDGDDAVSNVSGSSSGLPPPLIRASSYESFICCACVLKINALKKIAGTRGVMMVVRDTPQDAWKIIGEDTDESEADIVQIADEGDDESGNSAGEKRKNVLVTGDKDSDAPPAKRPRPTPEPSALELGFPQPSPCLAPSPNPLAQRVLSHIEDAATSSADNLNSGGPHGAGDVFLTEGFRGRWCRCHMVSSQ